MIFLCSQSNRSAMQMHYNDDDDIDALIRVSRVLFEAHL